MGDRLRPKVEIRAARSSARCGNAIRLGDFDDQSVPFGFVGVDARCKQNPLQRLGPANVPYQFLHAARARDRAKL
jgi:hypothetical protein